MLVVITLAQCSSLANAETIFRDCEDIAADSNYRLLQKYISTKDEGNVLCQRVDENSFLYTAADNIYYCKSNNGSPLKCEENEKGLWLSDLTLVKRFNADNGIQFAMFKSGSLLKGKYRQSYRVVNLVSNKVNSRGFAIFVFPEAGAADSNNGSGACDGINESEVVSPSKPAFEVANENQNNVVVRFSQVRKSCKTKVKVRQTLEYTWTNGAFKQTKNLNETLKSDR
jgi:hypothetical protein